MCYYQPNPPGCTCSFLQLIQPCNSPNVHFYPPPNPSAKPKPIVKVCGERHIAKGVGQRNCLRCFGHGPRLYPYQQARLQHQHSQQQQKQQQSSTALMGGGGGGGGGGGSTFPADYGGMVYGKYGPGSVSQTISVSGAPASAGTFVSGTGSGSISGLGKRRAESIARSMSKRVSRSSSSSASPSMAASVAASVPASVSASVSAPPAVSSMAYEGGDGTKLAPPVTSLTTSPDAIWTGTVTALVSGIGIRKAESASGENQTQDRGLEASNDYQLGDWREGESMLQLLSPMSFSPPLEQEDQKGGGKVCVEQADERARMDSLFEKVNETAGQVGDMKVDEAVKEEKDELIIGKVDTEDRE